MKFTIAVPVMNQPEVTQQWLDSFKNTQKEDNQYLIVDNGSNPAVRDWLIGLTTDDLVIRNGENFGVLKSLNQAWQVLKDTDTDYIFYTHNDVMMYEQDWDEKLRRILQHENNRIDIPDVKQVGVAGFYGAKGIGTFDIFKSPYRMQQLIRLENVSNCNRMDKVHGYRPIAGGRETEDVAVMDGFSLIVNMRLLNMLNGFDRNFPPHHMYDNDICLESLDKGYRNIVIAMDAQHLGGRTDVGEDWSKVFNKTKQQVHEEAHPIFYKKWSPEMVRKGRHVITMPIMV